MIWEMILEKICYTTDRSTTKSGTKPEMEKAYEINNIRNRKCNGK